MNKLSTDILIEQLAEQPRSTTAEFNPRLLTLALLCITSLLLLLIIGGLLGFRSDWSLTAISKPLLFALIVACCTLQITKLAYPLESLHKPALLHLPFSAVCFMVLFTAPPLSLQEALNYDSYSFCLLFNTIAGLGIFALLRFMLRRARPASPHGFSAWLGLLSSALASGVYGLHCVQDAPMYILTAYFPMMLLVTAVAAVLPQKSWFW
jgi:hypothetical protein